MDQFTIKITEPQNQKVEIYLDYSTIPSLNYFLHFVENYQDQETIRLFGLERFTIPKHLISSYPEGIIQFFPICEHNIDSFNEAFYSVLKRSDKKLDIKIHLNLFHSLEMFLPLINSYIQFKDKVNSIEANFYDDGAEGIVTLYQLTNEENLTDFIKESILQMKLLKHDRSIFCKNKNVFRYLWSEYTNSKYHLLNVDFLEKRSELDILKIIMDKNYQEMDLYKYRNLSNKQKQIILSILDTNSSIEKLLNLTNKETREICVFTGTTLFTSCNSDLDTLENIHIKAIETMMNPKSKYYIGDNTILYYKGHPHPVQMNKNIKNRFKELVCIDSKIPLEILYILGLKIDKIGGFASTSYFFLPKDKFHHLFFITEKNNEEQSYIFKNQYTLLKVMLDLDYISPRQAHYYLEIFDNND